MTQWKLIIEDDAGKTIVVPLSRDEVTIGRKEGNTIRLTERNVSRQHAKLTKVNGTVSIEDLKSFNGIKINGDRIAGQVEVREGDLIEIGDYHLALQQEGAQDSTPTPVPPAAAPATGQGPVGSQAGAVGYELPEAADDEFAGDTQRWEPPAAMDVPVGMPTVNDGDVAGLDTQQQPMAMPPPADDEATMRNPAVAPAQPTAQSSASGFAHMSDETEAMPASPSQEQTIPLSAAPLTSPVDDEATIQNPVVPQMSAPAAAPEVTPAPAAEPPPAAPAPAAPAPGVNGAASHARLDARDEMTEQIRAAPGIKQDLNVPRLVVVNTMFAGSTYHVQGAQQVIGRTDDNDIAIGHRSVSRNHAKIVQDGARWAIHDMQSANGILVNGAEVDAFPLSSGDIIELGRVKVRFVPPGESFQLTPSEVEAARRAAALGEDDEPMAPVASGGGGNSTILVVGLMGLVILLLLVAVVALLVRGDDDKTDPSTKPKTTASAGIGAAKAKTPKPEPKKTAAKTKAPEPAPEPAAEPEAVAEPAAKPPPSKPKPTPRTRKPKKAPKPKVDPGKADESFRKGVAAHLSGKYKQARTHLTEAIRINPKHADAHRNLGVVHSRLGDAKRAYKHYKTYLKLRPGASDRARVQKILDDYDSGN